ncbi:MAG TPA: helix-turn-helix domain-containing protein [Solirubrobacterales bacterium]|nr:helix-turn-helix domain-containing protein [Solirubrobacterales bacterium]
MDSSASNPRSGSAASQSLPRAYAVRSERERLLEAMVRVAAAKGYEATTVGDVIEAAAVSRETFDEMFSDRESCFLEAYDAVIDVLVAHVSTAFESTVGQPWPDRIAAALRALVDLLATEHDIARMAMVEVTAVGEDARIRYRAALGRFTYFLEEGRTVSPQADELPADTARFAIGGATSMIFDEVRAGRGPELRRILPDLLFAVLMPYVGPEAAEDEMRRVAREG